MSKNDRFKKVYSQGKLEGMEIWIDRETGINYLFHFAGYSGGLTPLLDEQGKPVITPVAER
ncbi:MAG: xylan 1,4-beta-xylosidase [Lachnospiraceae bacterium]|nr:xylan 1,4-beta-xylosidase [Lachnospiraceae bacterium]